LPVIQILASVPATALFPLIVAGALRFDWGLDVAAVVLLLTGMQWYLLFNLVAGAQAMPADLRELAAANDVRGPLYWRRFFLPVATPSLLTGSITAWGGGWNALIISEYVSANGRTYSVEGLGALLDEATYGTGNLHMIVLTIMTMVVVITVLNRLLWRPLYERAAARYRLEY
jgi:NitT/TauT family transport system permease protein